MSKHARAGGKYSGSHTTLTPAACNIADIAQKSRFCSKVSLGIIESGLKPANGPNRVKIFMEDACIRLMVRGGTSMQELRVYGPNLQKLGEEIAKNSLSSNFKILFSKSQKN